MVSVVSPRRQEGPTVSALSPWWPEDLSARRVPVMTGGLRGDRRVPMVSPWWQEDLMVMGGPPLSRRVPMVSALSPQCQEDPRCQEDFMVTSR